MKKILRLFTRQLVTSQIRNPAALTSLKREFCKKYRIPFPSNIQLLRAYHELRKEKSIKKNKRIERLLTVKPIRSLSGIINVSVLTKPYPCPGECIFCPKENNIPKSYLSGEPAVERAKKLKFDPYLQVKNRLDMLRAQGHPTDKIDLRIIGGTWSFYPKRYRTWFVKRCFDACNKKTSKSLKQSQEMNEVAKRRIISISIETRPDFINEQEIKRMRKLGITKVELGAQTLSDIVLKRNKRKHAVKDLAEATRLLKDYAFKISYQMMLNLPGSSPKEDLNTFIELFENSYFRPDFLKIYPCALVKEAPLYKEYLRGKYKPYSKRTLINLIKEIKKKIPYYVRIERILRDIPSPKIMEGGTKVSNIRQVVGREIKKERWKCKCIRCREIKRGNGLKKKPFLFRKEYRASEGKEIFFSYESKNKKYLYSLLRLRIPSLNSPAKQVFPVLKGSTLIREVHTYGQLVPLSEKGAIQHRGLGKKLIREAERISKKLGFKKIAVISAVGTRQYYRRLGYKLGKTYMLKALP